MCVKGGLFWSWEVVGGRNRGNWCGVEYDDRMGAWGKAQQDFWVSYRIFVVRLMARSKSSFVLVLLQRFYEIDADHGTTTITFSKQHDYRITKLDYLLAIAK